MFQLLKYGFHQNQTHQTAKSTIKSTAVPGIGHKHKHLNSVSFLKCTKDQDPY